MKVDKRSFLKWMAVGLGAGSNVKTLFGQQDTAQFNWARNVRYGTDHLLEAESVEQLQEFVKKQPGVKTLGSRHCFSRIADSVHQLVSTRSMNRVLEFDETAKTVTVEAGIKYGELGPELERKGYTIHNLASLPQITVAGAIATATHGSGTKNGNLATAVSEIEFITADGELRTFSRTKNPKEFPAVVVHLGALGIVTKLKLDVQPTFQVREYSYRDLSMPQLYDHLGEIMNAAYSVSVFTKWDGASIRLKVREDSGFQAKSQMFGANLVENDKRNEPGPAWERLPHFRMDSLTDRGNELQTEYFVALDDAVDAIKAMATLGNRIRPLLYASELRTVAADDLWMSTAYRRPSLAIHFTWKPDSDGVGSLLPDIESKLAPFKARPHWGKLFAMDSETLASRYERLADFKKLASRLDPNGKFHNGFLRERIFNG